MTSLSIPTATFSNESLTLHQRIGSILSAGESFGASMKAMVPGCAKLIAGLLVVAVLGGAQCLNLCAISPCGAIAAVASTESETQASGKSPCHHDRDSQPKPSNSSQSCSHQEFVAEKRAGEFSPEVGVLHVALVNSLPGTLLEPSALLPSGSGSFRVRLKQPVISVLRI